MALLIWHYCYKPEEEGYNLRDAENGHSTLENTNTASQQIPLLSPPNETDQHESPVNSPAKIQHDCSTLPKPNKSLSENDSQTGSQELRTSERARLLSEPNDADSEQDDLLLVSGSRAQVGMVVNYRVIRSGDKGAPQGNLTVEAERNVYHATTGSDDHNRGTRIEETSTLVANADHHLKTMLPAPSLSSVNSSNSSKTASIGTYPKVAMLPPPYSVPVANGSGIVNGQSPEEAATDERTFKTLSEWIAYLDNLGNLGRELDHTYSQSNAASSSLQAPYHSTGESAVSPDQDQDILMLGADKKLEHVGYETE